MRTLRTAVLVCLAALPSAAGAQQADGFAVLQGSDTVAVERFTFEPHALAGSLVRAAGPDRSARERVRYRATLLDDASAPLIELSAWRAEDPEESPARQSTRIIFKGDSVAVDDATRWSGVATVVLGTREGAIPYLNLSIAFLELATRRARAAPADSLPVPFFNLGGGQTLTGTVRRLGADSAAVAIGPVEFRLRVDAAGRILGGRVPAQNLTILRSPAR